MKKRKLRGEPSLTEGVPLPPFTLGAAGAIFRSEPTIGDGRGYLLKRATVSESALLSSPDVRKDLGVEFERGKVPSVHTNMDFTSMDPADDYQPDQSLPLLDLRRAYNSLAKIAKLTGLDSELMDDAELQSWWERAGQYMGGPERRDALMAERGWSWEQLKAQQERMKATSHWLRTLNEDEAKWVNDLIDHIIKCAREFVLPPDSKSVANFELEAMNLAYLMYPLWSRERQNNDTDEKIAELTMSLRRKYLAVEKVWAHATKMIEIIDPKVPKWGAIETDETIENTLGQAWLKKWMDSSFARLEVSHKLCASLCLTDVPEDIEVKDPWECWSLIIPDGVIFNEPCRIWVYEGAPFAMVLNGTFRKIPAPTKKSAFETFPDKEARVWEMVYNLIRGACLALSNPEDFSKQSAGQGWKSSKKSSRKGPPELSQARFLLSAPVKVDLREEVRRVITGERKGSSPKVQFLVRGHWRNQVHGPKRSLRKTIWIQPFWKGDEEARVLLRHTEIKESPKE